MRVETSSRQHRSPKGQSQPVQAVRATPKRPPERHPPPKRPKPSSRAGSKLIEVACAVCFVWLCFLSPEVSATGLGESEYAGSDRCGQCHPAQHEGWKQTVHATAIKDARADPSAIQGDFSARGLPFTREEVEYVIGGHWYERYMKRIGEDYFILPRSWSVQARQWRVNNQWGWNKVPYSQHCKGCHVIAYAPGAIVEAAEDRIGCGACHGPGRAHAESGGVVPILSLRKLTPEKRNMICAACHVRGRDRSGKYPFPIGYVPGEDLGEHYVPYGKQDGETTTQAINRLFEIWKKRRARGGLQDCDVCAIPGRGGLGDGAEVDVLQSCRSCHHLEAEYARHTRHAESAGLRCLDCHTLKKAEIINRPALKDIHSPEYFLLHEDNCFEPNLAPSCLKCHGDESMAWAQNWVNHWQDKNYVARTDPL